VAAEDSRLQTPKRWDDIKIFGEVPFSHQVISPPMESFPLGIFINGRVDYAIGVVLKSGAKHEHYKRRFQSRLLVEAKFERGVELALPELLVYLACLHQSRLQRLRSDASVYGLVSDGFAFIFVAILHDGVVQLSRRFDVLQGDLRVVLGCLKYVLEKTANMLAPERNGSGDNLKQGSFDETTNADAAISLDDDDFLNPPSGEEENDHDGYTMIVPRNN
jgi:hypothetical protein